MGLISRITGRQFKPGKGVDCPSPRHGFPRFFFLLWNHFWRLMTVNLIFVACCLPVVTIPAAICALDRYLVVMARDGYGFSLGDFFKEFKAEIFRAMPLGLICGGLYLTAYYLLGISPAFAASTVQTGVTVTGATLCLTLAMLLGNYGFLLMAMLELSVGAVIKDALILLCCEPVRSLGVMVTGVFTLLPIILFYPYSIPFAALLWFAIPQLAVMLLLNPVVERRILVPYAELQRAAAEGVKGAPAAEQENDEQP